MKALNYDKKTLKQLKNNYFTAKALYETIKEEAEKIQKDILLNNEFYISDEYIECGFSGQTAKERITRPFDSFLMSDNDFEKYLDLCYAGYQKAGIDDKRGKEYCPDAEARELYKETEKQLVLYAIDIIPASMVEVKETLAETVKIVKYRDKVLDLILRLE